MKNSELINYMTKIRVKAAKGTLVYLSRGHESFFFSKQPLGSPSQIVSSSLAPSFFPSEKEAALLFSFHI